MAPGCVLWKLPRLKSLSRDFCCSTRGTKLWLVSFREILSTGKLGKSVSDFHKFWKTTPSYEKPKADIGSMDARCLSLWSLERLKKKRTGLTVEFLPRTQRRIYWISLKRSMKLQRHPLKQIMKIWWWEMDLLRSPFWIMSLTQALEFWWPNCKHVSPVILLKEREGSKEWCYMICLDLLIWDCGSDVGLESAPFRRNNCLKVKMRPMLSRCAPVMVLVKQCLQCHWHQILSKTRDATSVLLYLSRIKSSLLLATNNFITSLEGFRVFFLNVSF